MNKFSKIILGSVLGINAVYAEQMVATIQTTNNAQANGDVVFMETPYGLLITPNLTGLPAGLHGFHIHQHADCGHSGNDAGGHLDPQNTNTHRGPYGQGHLGDLPVLYVSNEGKAITPVLAPRLKLADLKGTSLMIHANGDNYTDTPTLGGGGARIACGPIK
jgi:Cu-Zn family superoxide dismutase